MICLIEKRYWALDLDGLLYMFRITTGLLGSYLPV
jgi:hypothetical protein